MVSSIIEHRKFNQVLEGIEISYDLCVFMDTLKKKTFYSAFVCTKELQVKEFCVGDFVTSWNN